MPPKNVRTTEAQVVEKSWVSPHLVRLVLAAPGGGPLSELPGNEFADAYVKVVLPPRGVTLPWPYDAAELRETLPPEQWPVMRTYTIRSFDGVHLTLDFVVHGDEGIAGPWARDVEPFGEGSLVQLRGPGGAYSPDLDADHHLLVGDASALPAIAVALERLPSGASADVVVEVEDAADEIELPTLASATVRWVHAACSSLPPGEEIVAVVRSLRLPGSGDDDEGATAASGLDVHAFVHGEAGWVKELRSHLRFERGVPRERLSISGYWRRGVDDEQWRESKREWNAQVEATELAATGG
ncbi:NADPH-dependent ferric siderophore reductase [Salana multivorans]|uniref:NADPH-dependent ferric siderophore reductase n=1 Tax=Salana multivorans TaxID=120377 RepID=A0A3N2DBA7_9MICO|nr:siderophore-interacting protein [Salana multivorans]ROR97091.1 NADPH-dependent ferric siderophore reductase [Salana multivorans]